MPSRGPRLPGSSVAEPHGGRALAVPRPQNAPMSDVRRDPAIRVILLPRDTNGAGTIFGGVILSYIDLAAVVEATRINPHARYVTRAMKEIEFHEPVFVGDIVSFYTELKKVGRTSITVQVEVQAQRRDDPAQIVDVTSAEVVYVAVDENRRPIPIESSFEPGGAGN